MTEKHTPGPWVHHPDDNIISTHDRRKLLEWQARSQFVSQGERDANARLIAAAPELLEALQAVINYDSTNHKQISLLDNEVIWKNAIAAIIKATGSAS